jgi:hypothetical protein
VLGRWSLSWLRVIALGFGVWQLEFMPSWIVIQAKSLLSMTLFKLCILLFLNEIHDSDMSLKRFGANQQWVSNRRYLGKKRHQFI